MNDYQSYLVAKAALSGSGRTTRMLIHAALMSVHKKVWVVLSSEDDIAKFKEERLLPPGICVFTPESLTRMVGHKAVNWQRMCLTDMYERPIESVTLLVDHSVLENMYETVIRHMHRYDDPTEFYVSPTKTLDLFDTSTL